MKTNFRKLRFKYYQVLMICLVSTVFSPSCQTNEGAFFVEANCKECVSVLLEESEKISGVKSVNWVEESSFLEVTYGSTSLEVVQEALASKGFSTQFYLANDSAGQLLPACCNTPLNRKLEVYTPSSEE